MTASQVPCTTSSAPPPLRFRTADYAPRDRLQAWHDLYGRTFLKVDLEPIDPDVFHTDVSMRRLPGLGIIVGSRSATLYRRRVVDSDDVIVSIGLAGGFEATQFGRIANMEAGDAVVVTGGEPGYVRVPESGRSMSLCVPWRAISHAASSTDAAVCQRIPAATAPLRLLIRYVELLEQENAFASPELQRQSVTHVHDLIALAIGASREAGEIAWGRGARAARFAAIKRDIVEHIAEPGLSITAVATRHRLSPRYVRMLFEAEGLSFTDYVLMQRLACAQRMLSDPRFARAKIATLAFDCGFNDLSYFNRAFRRRYGTTPSDVRAMAWPTQAPAKLM